MKKRDFFVHPNPAAIFDAAIKAGFLSTNPASETFADDWMYMYHTDDGKAHFKSRTTRRYKIMQIGSKQEAGDDGAK